MTLLLWACTAPEPEDTAVPSPDDTAVVDTAPPEDTAPPDPCAAGDAAWHTATDGTVTSLDEAFRAGAEGAAVQLTLAEPGALSICPGTWHVYLKAQAELVVEGLEGAERTVLDAHRAGPVVEVEGELALTVRGLTVQGGRSMHGGGVWARLGAQVTVQDAVLRDNETETDGHGGGLCASDGSAVWLERVQLEGNRAAEGGGVAVMDSTAELVDIAFEANEVSGKTLPGYGGGLFVEGGTAKLSRATFTDNVAGSAGGAIAGWSGAELSLEDVHGSGDTAVDRGGGLYLSFSDASLARSSFTGSSAEAGGGIAAKYGTVVLDEGGVYDATAVRGAGIDLYASSLVLTGSAVTGNVADEAGGGVYLDPASTLTAEEVSIDGNAPEDVYVEDVGGFQCGKQFSCDGTGCG